MLCKPMMVRRALPVYQVTSILYDHHTYLAPITYLAHRLAPQLPFSHSMHFHTLLTNVNNAYQCVVARDMNVAL